MSDTSNVNHSHASRRYAKEQGQKLDQAANAIQGLLHPFMQMQATWLALCGDSCIAAANMIDSFADGIRQPRSGP